jgi:hypothetical protein
MDCPQCFGPMSKRTNSRDNSQFWGCDDFPECRGTKNIGERPQQSSGRSRGRPAWLDAVEADPEESQCFDQLPSALSPSRATDFMQCPRKFYEKTITKRVVFQGSEASVKGKLVHLALEKIFDRVPTQRPLPKQSPTFVHTGKRSNLKAKTRLFQSYPASP